MLSDLTVSGVSASEELRRLPYKSATVFFPQREFPLHAMLSSGGHSLETETDYSWDGTARGKTSFAVLQLTLGGAGRLDIRGGSVELLPKTFMLVHIPGPHRYWLPPEAPSWEFVYLVVYGRELLRLILGIERRQGNVITLSDSSRIPTAFLSVLQPLLSSNSFTPFEISS
ncbi:MAG TPA: AraC family ligand binding domain-containing protein [Spirochaetia bacterium]|nr:AraC family ligand binding domain-containing protein [Spirochaetia bacterium]